MSLHGLGWPAFFHHGIGRHVVFAVRVAPLDHHAAAVLEVEPPDEGAQGGLLIKRAKSDRPEHGFQLEAAGRERMFPERKPSIHRR